MSVILGLDPGIATIGWAIVEKRSGDVKLKDCGAILTSKSETLERRLEKVFIEITRLLDKFKPDVVAVEQLYFATNAKTAITVAHARGVILLACSIKKKVVISYAPLAVKKTITGDGRADKTQIQFMITKLLKIESAPKPDDVSDAVAIAITHAYTNYY